MFEKLLQYVPHWVQLKVLGNNKFIRSSYFWLFFVPTAAKVMNKINSTADIKLFGAVFTINISLPFSWQLFYLSSIFFALGSAVFQIHCPASLKKYSSFNDWKEHGKDESALIISFLALYREKFPHWPFKISDSQKNYFIKFLTAYKGDVRAITREDRKTPVDLIKAGIPEENLKAAFYYVVDRFSFSKPILRLICILLYTAGFITFSIVLIENFYYVFTNEILS